MSPQQIMKSPLEDRINFSIHFLAARKKNLATSCQFYSAAQYMGEHSASGQIGSIDGEYPNFKILE